MANERFWGDELRARLIGGGRVLAADPRLRLRARLEVIFDLGFDHAVARAAVPASAANARDGLARTGSRCNGSFDFGFRDGQANADVHAVLKIMKPVFIIKGGRGVLSARASKSARNYGALAHALKGNTS